MFSITEMRTRRSGEAPRGLERALRVEVLGEERAGAELIAELEAGDEFAPEHSAAAVQLQAAVPGREHTTGLGEVDGGIADDDARSGSAALHERGPKQLGGQTTVAAPAGTEGRVSASNSAFILVRNDRAVRSDPWTTEKPPSRAVAWGIHALSLALKT